MRRLCLDPQRVGDAGHDRVDACRTGARAARVRRRASVPCNSTRVGMMFGAVPPWMLPMVSTAGSSGGDSRETSVCSATINSAAATTGSATWWGIAAWPPVPLSSMSKASAEA